MRLSQDPHGWHRQDILAEVRKRGSSLAGIGRDTGLTRQTMVWACIRPHPRANRAIADFLGVTMHELWPQWFDADGAQISTAPLRRARPVAPKATPARTAASSPLRHAS